jgi:hypothetical protein
VMRRNFFILCPANLGSRFCVYTPVLLQEARWER